MWGIALILKIKESDESFRDGAVKESWLKQSLLLALEIKACVITFEKLQFMFLSKLFTPCIKL